VEKKYFNRLNHPQSSRWKEKKYIKLVHSAWFRAVTKRCEFYDVKESLGLNQKKKKPQQKTLLATELHSNDNH
jgi:hypothetical protein